MRGWTPPGSPSRADLHSLTGGLRRPKRRVPRHEVPTAMCPPARFRKDLAISSDEGVTAWTCCSSSAHSRATTSPAIRQPIPARQTNTSSSHTPCGRIGWDFASHGAPRWPPVSRQAPALHVSTAPTRPIAPTRRNRRADSGLTTDSTRSICLSDGSRTDTFLRLHRKLRAAVRQPTDAVQARTSRSLRFGCATHQMPHAI